MNDRITGSMRGIGGFTSAAALIVAMAVAGHVEAAEKQPEFNSLGLEEIVVTAQKREQRLIDTPISVGVLSGDDLFRSSSRGVADVLNQVGGLSLIEQQPGQVQIAVRGVLSGAGPTTTAYYQDEVPIAFIRSAELPDTNAFDLARVEVLRGPQGTLYGAAALGGVVRVLTNDADLDNFEAKGRLRTSSTESGGGNYGGDMAINVPLVSGKLAIRAVGSYSDMDGFIDSSSDGGRRINSTEAQAYRLKVGYQASENFNMKLGASRSKIENAAPSRALDNFRTPFSADQPDERVFDAYNLIAEYRLTSVSLLSATSYLDYDIANRHGELLSGVIPITLITGIPLTSFSQEFRLVSQLEGPWQWSAGAMYKDTTEKNFFAAAALVTPSRLTEHSESYAAFGEVTRSFSEERFALTAGLRLFKDRLTTTEYSRFITGTTVLGPPTVTDFKQPTGRVVLTYKPEEDLTFYGSVATGFRSGMNQTQTVLAIDPALPALDADSLITYELGAKGRRFDSALTYDIAIYYTDWKDIQQSLVLPAGFAARLNAGRASGLGVDASTSLQLTEALDFHVSIGWNDLQFDENVPQFVPAAQQSVVLFSKGSRLNSSPEWTGSVGGSYRKLTPWAGTRVVLSTNYEYRSALQQRFLTGTTLANTPSDEFSSLRASAGLEGSRWSLEVYGDNLLNHDGAITPPSAILANTSVRQRPRTIGLQVTYSY